MAVMDVQSYGSVTGRSVYSETVIFVGNIVYTLNKKPPLSLPCLPPQVSPPFTELPGRQICFLSAGSLVIKKSKYRHL